MISRESAHDDPGRGDDQPAPEVSADSGVAQDSGQRLPAHVLLVAGYRSRPYLTLKAAERGIQTANDHGHPARMYLGRVEWLGELTSGVDPVPGEIS